MPGHPLHLLFVCSGNLCRSPMAEGIARHIGEQQGIELEARSCGTIARPGMPASERAVIACREKDVDISDHQSQPLTRELVEWADQILVMEENHLHAVNAKDWRAPFKTWALGSFINRSRIKDPYKRSMRKYRKARDQVWKAVDLALQRLAV
jgi:protein-tyrosine-phosphatase